jgi:hypothetical protein
VRRIVQRILRTRDIDDPRAISVDAGPLIAHQMF